MNTGTTKKDIFSGQLKQNGTNISDTNPLPVKIVSGGSSDYTAILNQIKAGVDAIDGDTNDLAPIKTSVANLETLITNGNATQSQIKTAIDALLVQAQSINANTNEVEAKIQLLIDSTIDTEELLVCETINETQTG